MCPLLGQFCERGMSAGSYEDPLRWRTPNADTDSRCTGSQTPEVIENDLCSLKVVVMHKPTHDASLRKSYKYPYGSHLGGKKRLWEVRLQLRFKHAPVNPLFFGVELSSFIALEWAARQAQKALVSACTTIVGDLYHTNGDDPAQARGGGELEPPTVAMPLWAFDYFEVSDQGKEPDLSGEMKSGLNRADDVQKYIAAMKAAMSSVSTDKVYTFCFWGVSRFLDAIKWEVTGDTGLPISLDFNQLCGAAPIYLVIYELDNVARSAKDQKHMRSNKKYYVNVACWSTLNVPKGGVVCKFPENAVASSAAAVAPAPAPAPAPASVDLLGDMFAAPAASGAGGYSAAAAPTQTVDLLGEMGGMSISGEPPKQASPAPNADLIGLDLLG